jgi:hypothetical protein
MTRAGLVELDTLALADVGAETEKLNVSSKGTELVGAKYVHSNETLRSMRRSEQEERAKPC